MTAATREKLKRAIEDYFSMDNADYHRLRDVLKKIYDLLMLDECKAFFDKTPGIDNRDYMGITAAIENFFNTSIQKKITKVFIGKVSDLKNRLKNLYNLL